MVEALKRERRGRGTRISMLAVIESELRLRDRLRAKPDTCTISCGFRRVPKRTKIVCPWCGAWDWL